MCNFLNQFYYPHLFVNFKFFEKIFELQLSLKLKIYNCQGEDGDQDGNEGEVIKKGDDEYIVVVSGSKDTGLSGSYWQTEDLPRRRSCTTTTTPPPAPPPVAKKSTPVAVKRGQDEGEDDTTPPPAKRGRKPKDASGQ